MTGLAPPEYIDCDAALEAWIQRLRSASVIAVDTESDSFHHYREKVCLIQMTADGRDAIIDPLAGDARAGLDKLNSIFSDPQKTKVFHDAGYDLICLRRDFGFTFDGIFDTMLASRLLGERDFGLASILLRRFEHRADKRFQRSDWAKRPLSAEQIAYARFDTHFLPELAEQLEKELKVAGRWDWAQEDFGRLPGVADRVTRRDGPDPDGFWKIRGISLKSPLIRGRAKSLYLARDRIAARLDRPPFKVFGDAVIADLAEDPPPSLAEFEPRPGLRRGGVDRFGAEIIRALRRAKPIKGKPPPGTGRRRRAGRFADPDARRRYETLRQWRRRQAESLGLEPEVVLANATLEGLAKKPPRNRSQVHELPQLQGWRGEKLAPALLKLLQNE